MPPSRCASAASELQRQDPAAAARAPSGRRSSLRADGAASCARHAGRRASARAADLRLEAQQIVEAQRRIATEAQRMPEPKPGQARGDAGASAPGNQPGATRRLAAEQDELADRVDDLRALRPTAWRAGRAGEHRSGGARRRRGARCSIASRSADACGIRPGNMRDDAGASRATERPGSDQEIARALDKAARRARSGSTSADAQALSAAARARRVRCAIGSNALAADRSATARTAARESISRRAAVAAGTGRTRRPDGPPRRRPAAVRPASSCRSCATSTSRELQRTRDTLGRLEAEQRSGQHMSYSREQEFSRPRLAPKRSSRTTAVGTRFATGRRSCAGTLRGSLLTTAGPERWRRSARAPVAAIAFRTPTAGRSRATTSRWQGLKK